MTRPTPRGPLGTQGTRYWNGTGRTAAGAAPPTAADDGNPGPNHATHLEPGFRDFMSAHPVLTGIAVLAGVVLILVDWKAFLLLASLAGVVTGLAVLGMLAIDSWQRRRQEKAAFAARADDQNEALLRGDHQWGVFGLRPAAEPFLDRPPRSGKSGRASLAAGVAVVAALVVFAVMATVHARSADQAPRARPVSAPTATMTAPASRSIPRPINPTAPQHIPLPVVPAPLPAPPSPSTQPSAPVRLGQHAVDGNVTFVVTSVDPSKTVANPSFPFMQTTAKGTFLTAQLTITNNGNQAEVFIASYQKLRINDAVYVPDPAAALWTMTLETIVGPGTTATAALSFDVPTDTPPGGILELHRSSNSRGANVELLPPQ
jgi:hypothetical protein